MAGRSIRAAGVPFVLLGLAGAAAAAQASEATQATRATRERTAVVIVAAGDVQLSDDLTELAIARIADRRDRDLIGIPELRPRLRELAGTDDLAGCVADPSCLAKLGGAAGAARALGGAVREADAGFLLKLVLIDTRTARQEAEVSVSVPRDQGQLIAALRTGIDDLLRAPSPVTKPVSVATVPPPAGKPGNPSLLAQPPASGEESHPIARNIGYAAGAVAVVAIVAAAVTGAIATGKPTGDNRRDAQADLERREDYATASTTLWITSGLASAVAVGALTWRWRAP
jgi:hypothetical protein